MKVPQYRPSGGTTISMTPMIDIVFLLIIFSSVTFTLLIFVLVISMLSIISCITRYDFIHSEADAQAQYR